MFVGVHHTVHGIEASIHTRTPVFDNRMMTTSIAAATARLRIERDAMLAKRLSVR